MLPFDLWQLLFWGLGGIFFLQVVILSVLMTRSRLLDTVGMPEVEYSAFLKYQEMKDKYDYMQNFSVENKTEIAKTLAAFALAGPEIVRQRAG